MINLDDYDLFRDNKDTLKELSKDDPNDGQSDPEYMTESEVLAVDFDEVKRLYTNAHGHSENDASSVDGLSCTDQKIVFLEFKNGVVSNKSRINIKDKVRDSLLIFGDITNTNVSYTRQNADFVLVYNENKNPAPNQLTGRVVQAPTKSLLTIAQCLAKLGEEDFVRFGMERFKGLYFKNVHTYTQEEFEKFIPQLKE